MQRAADLINPRLIKLRDRLRHWFPRVGEPQPRLGDGFHAAYREFCLDHRERLLELCAGHRYQMNEVGRCADLLPALGPVIEDGQEIVLVDIGTGAGLALHLDRYRYVYRAGGEATVVGDPAAKVVLETTLRGSQLPPLPSAVPRIADRVGIDIEPAGPWRSRRAGLARGLHSAGDSEP